MWKSIVRNTGRHSFRGYIGGIGRRRYAYEAEGKERNRVEGGQEGKREGVGTEVVSKDSHDVMMTLIKCMWLNSYCNRTYSTAAAKPNA